MPTALLSVIVFSPLALGLVLMLLPKTKQGLTRSYSLIATVAHFALVLSLAPRFLATDTPLMLEEQRTWFTAWGSTYHLNMDGLSYALVLLNALLTPFAILISWKAVREKTRAFHFFIFAMQTAAHGVFLAADGLLFYFFWEFSLIPMYFLIGIWGGERRIYATIKFVLYTLLGSLLMLVAMIWLALAVRDQAGQISFALADWKTLSISVETQRWLFLAFFVAFAIKVPLFPLHTWLPDAHVEAPTAGSVLLAGVLLKLGTYGILRFCLPLFPEAALLYQRPIVWLGMISLIYGAAMVLVQTDFKKMVAYSSVSHMGACVLGIFSFTLSGNQGAALTMINHGISTGALFMIVGIFYERTHTRDLGQYGGAVAKMPALGLLFLPIAMSSMGVPGTNGFVSEFLVLRGLFKWDPMMGALATTGIVLSAAYMLRLTQKVMYGPIASHAMEELTDLDLREKLSLGALVLIIFALGIFPQIILGLTENSVNSILLSMIRPVAGAGAP